MKATTKPHESAFIIFYHLSTLQKLQKIPGKLPIAKSHCLNKLANKAAVTVLGLLIG